MSSKTSGFVYGISVAGIAAMNVSLYQAASALTAASRWQEVISENLASATIPGFKKQELSFATVQAGMLQAGNGSRVALPKIQTNTSFQAGEIRYTGVNTDVAIDGSGFFEVQLANGASAYTRDGEFQVNTQGQLITKQGYAVLGENGPIQLDQNNHTPVSISATGEVSQGPDIKGKLKLVQFDQPNLLRQINGGYFLAEDPNLQQNPVAQPSVRQGFLEAANTSSMVEMANLIRSMRSFEANQRIIQLQDERMGHAISELGSPT
jgi:flagellar basal-body rod protein FlgF